MNRNRKNIQKFQLSVNCFTFQHNEALTEFKRHKDRYRFLFMEKTYETEYIQKGLLFCI